MMNNIFLIILTNLILYFRFINYDFVSDDVPHYQGKGNKEYQHLISLGLHTANCVLIYLAFGRNNISLVASLLFAINPVNIQGGLWASGRYYSLRTFFALLPMLIDLRLWILSVPISFIALRNFKSITLRINDKKATNKETNIIALRKLVLFFKTFKYYLFLCLFNLRLGFFHTPLKPIGTIKRYDKENYSLNIDFWLGIGLFGIISVLVLINTKNVIGIGLIWFIYNFCLHSNIITIQQIIAERYIYLANAGLMVSLAYFLPYPVNLLVLGWYACRNWYYLPSFKSEYWLNNYNVTEQKDNWYAWNLLGQKEVIESNITGGLKYFMEAYKHNPYDFRVLMNIAQCHILFGDLRNAEKYLKEAEVNLYDDEDCRLFLKERKDLVRELELKGQMTLKELNGRLAFCQ